MPITCRAHELVLLLQEELAETEESDQTKALRLEQAANAYDQLVVYADQSDALNRLLGAQLAAAQAELEEVIAERNRDLATRLEAEEVTVGQVPKPAHTDMLLMSCGCSFEVSTKLRGGTGSQGCC